MELTDSACSTVSRKKGEIDSKGAKANQNAHLKMFVDTVSASRESEVVKCSSKHDDTLDAPFPSPLGRRDMTRSHNPSAYGECVLIGMDVAQNEDA